MGLNAFSLSKCFIFNKNSYFFYVVTTKFFIMRLGHFCCWRVTALFHIRMIEPVLNVIAPFQNFGFDIFRVHARLRQWR